MVFQITFPYHICMTTVFHLYLLYSVWRTASTLEYCHICSVENAFQLFHYPCTISIVKHGVKIQDQSNDWCCCYRLSAKAAEVDSLSKEVQSLQSQLETQKKKNNVSQSDF